MSALPPADQNAQVSQSKPAVSLKQEPDDLKQELDVDAMALSKVPADPLLQTDPFASVFQPVNKLTDAIAGLERLKFGATYTFLNQYATVTPGGVRHDQLSGRLDFTGAWVAYENGSTAGSISLLVRSGSNIGMSQRFNLSDSLGSGLFLNCLQGGGPLSHCTTLRECVKRTRSRLRRTSTSHSGRLTRNDHPPCPHFC